MICVVDERKKAILREYEIIENRIEMLEKEIKSSGSTAITETLLNEKSELEDMCISIDMAIRELPILCQIVVRKCYLGEKVKGQRKRYKIHEVANQMGYSERHIQRFATMAIENIKL